jgi:hypothetical protein
MSSKDAMFSTVLRKSGNRLIYNHAAHEALYKTFVQSLEEGQVVQIFFDANTDDGNLAQLAKVHKCIRELAKETGVTFEDMKLEIKKAAGMCVVKEIGGEKYMVCKSFGDSSKDDLSMVIQTIIQRGDFVGINFR